MIQSWGYEYARNMVNDLVTQNMIKSYNNFAGDIFQIISPTAEMLNKALEPLLSTLNNIQLPKIDSKTANAVEEMSQTFKNLDIATNLEGLKNI